MKREETQSECARTGTATHITLHSGGTVDIRDKKMVPGLTKPFSE